MTRTMPLWYDKEHAMFELIRKDHPRLEVVRVPGGLVVIFGAIKICVKV